MNCLCNLHGELYPNQSVILFANLFKSHLFLKFWIQNISISKINFFLLNRFSVRSIEMQNKI